jgi:predicted Kef-type K+ transport protein
MLILLIVVAYAFGFLLNLLKLPPMVGFLLAGFAYKASGLEIPAGLDEVADLGVTLLLFSIGLKLDLRSLAKAEIWLGSLVHIIVSTLLFSFILMGAKQFIELDLFQLELPTIITLGFAFSFSSTVFAVKVLEEKGNMYTFFGKVAIGILVMQDIFAVLFLSISEGKMPKIWAFAVLALPLIRPLLFKLLDKSGHGELLVLSSLFLALGVGAGGFSLMGLKPDLGALVLGIVISKHPKAGELSKAFFNFKELMLVAFFLSIGLKGDPSLTMVVVALLFCLVVPVKTGLYFLVLSRFGLRTRSNLLASLSLANFSEFGLIVAAMGTSQGILPIDWLLIIALAISISFGLAAPTNNFSEHIYIRMKFVLDRFLTKKIHPSDMPIDIGNAKVVVIGMGRVGTGAYKEFNNLLKTNVLGIEHDSRRAAKLKEDGYNVIVGDADDSDFWLKLKLDPDLELVCLATPIHKVNLFAAQQIMKLNIDCKIAAISHFPDQQRELEELGVRAFNMYNESGAGLARHALQ